MCEIFSLEISILISANGKKWTIASQFKVIQFLVFVTSSNVYMWLCACVWVYEYRDNDNRIFSSLVHVLWFLLYLFLFFIDSSPLFDCHWHVVIPWQTENVGRKKNESIHRCSIKWQSKSIKMRCSFARMIFHHFQFIFNRIRCVLFITSVSVRARHCSAATLIFFFFFRLHFIEFTATQDDDRDREIETESERTNDLFFWLFYFSSM